MWDPLGVFLLGHCVRLRIIRDFSNRVLISFYSFYHSIELSFLHRFDLKFRNLIFNLEGQKSLFTQNLDTIFKVTKTHQKYTFWKLDISPNDFVFFVDFVWSPDRDVLSPAIY